MTILGKQQQELAKGQQGMGAKKIHPRPIVIVQGAQWGSEAKGAISAWMCSHRKVDLAVRTGAVNAGHTVMYPPMGGDGEMVAYKMQQLPTGWVSNRTTLVLGAGTFVSPEILHREIEMVSAALGEDITDRLLIDNRVSLHLPEHTDQAKLENRHHAIGATGKGCSVAITDKIRYRGKGYKLFKQWWEEAPPIIKATFPLFNKLKWTDTAATLHAMYDLGRLILLEGTQGTLLDLHLGPYPYTTHKQSIASQWVTEAGLSPSMEYEVVSVARTMPIRVAGNSGPMPGETTWPNLARDINRKLMLHRLPQMVPSWAIEEFDKCLHEIATSGAYPLPKNYDDSPNYDMHKWADSDRTKYRVALSEMHKDALNMMSASGREEVKKLFEMTTVTQKLRRIAQMDMLELAYSCMLNRPNYIVLTFFNYWFPETWGQKFDSDLMWKGNWWSQDRQTAIKKVEERSGGTPVRFVSTGPGSDHIWPVIFNEAKADKMASGK